MLRNQFIPVLALIGLILAVVMMYLGLRKPAVAQVVFEPARSPYEHFIAGEGILEAVSTDLRLSVVFPDLVAEVFHEVGDIVTKGTELFRLDIRRLTAELNKAEKELAFAITEFEDKAKRFSYFERLKDTSAVSERDFTIAKYDSELAQRRVDTAQAAVDIIKMDLERSIVRAPIDGELLQVNIQAGEFANVNPFDRVPLMEFGNTEIYNIRVDIDEADAWRYKKGSNAMAFVRGNPSIKIPLTFSHIEPKMVPKKYLSGAATEIVDTRVLQVLYHFPRHGFPVYVGQMLDIFIEVSP